MTTRRNTRMGVLMAAGALAIMMATAVGKAATSDQQLFEAGSIALSQQNYVDAAMYLFAYLERHPAAVAQDPAHASQVLAAIDESRRRIYDEDRRLRQEISNLTEQLGNPVRARVSGNTLVPSLDPPNANSRPNSPLACRGAGNMRVDLLSEGYGVTGTMFAIEFRRAAAAGAASLGAGECAWLDRPVAAGEPNRICDLVETSSLHLGFFTDGQVQLLGSRSATYLPRLVAGTDVVTFRVFNNREGCMVVTSVAPLPGRGRRGGS